MRQSAKKVVRYDVKADGTLENRRVFVDMNSDPRPGNPDGMKIDVRGNVWDSGPGGIWTARFSPRNGSRNLAWGDQDGMTLYTTGGTMVTRIRVKVAGFQR